MNGNRNTCLFMLKVQKMNKKVFVKCIYRMSVMKMFIFFLLEKQSINQILSRDQADIFT